MTTDKDLPPQELAHHIKASITELARGIKYPDLMAAVDQLAAMAASAQRVAPAEVLSEAMRLVTQYGNASHEWGDYRGAGGGDLFDKVLATEQALRSFLSQHLGAQRVEQAELRQFDIERVQQAMTPDQLQEQERCRRELWDMIHGVPAAQAAQAGTPTQMLLYEHEDGRYAVAPVGQASFTDGDPKWHRVGPATMHLAGEPQTAAQGEREALHGLLRKAEALYEQLFYAKPSGHKYDIDFNAARAALSAQPPAAPERPHTGRSQRGEQTETMTDDERLGPVTLVGELLYRHKHDINNTPGYVGSTLHARTEKALGAQSQSLNRQG